jgi:2'-5' RNA ligase
MCLSHDYYSNRDRIHPRPPSFVSDLTLTMGEALIYTTEGNLSFSTIKPGARTRNNLIILPYMANTIRTFIAVEISENIQDELGLIIENFQRERITGIRWVSPRNIHITLRFLGDIKFDTVPALQAMIKESTQQFHPFDLYLDQAGAFPNLKNPRVIWVGIKRSEKLLDIQKIIESGCVKLGFPSENKRFSAHLTLGRVKKNLDEPSITRLIQQLQAVETKHIPPAHIEAAHLFKSDLKPGGSVYTSLFNAKLGSKKNI